MSNHLVNLSVMRTSSPSLSTTLPHYYERTTLAAPALDQLDPSRTHLLLPASFGSIYLGQTFTALLSLAHHLPPQVVEGEREAEEIVLDPVLKVEMHTAGGPNNPDGIKHLLRTISSSSSSSASTPTAIATTTTLSEREEGRLLAGESIEGSVVHEIKELGLHALICTVTYGVSTPTSEIISRSFRKVYKFNVSNPLSVRTKAIAPPSGGMSLPHSERKKIFLELQIQNLLLPSPPSSLLSRITSSTLYFDTITFKPLPSFELVSSSSDGGEGRILKEGDINQYVFVLRSLGGIERRGKEGESEPLGRLELRWTGPEGEKGGLTTSLLGWKIPPSSIPLGIRKGENELEKTNDYTPVELLKQGDQRVSGNNVAVQVEVLGVSSLAGGTVLRREEPFELELRVTTDLLGSQEEEGRQLQLAVQMIDYHSLPSPFLDQNDNHPKFILPTPHPTITSPGSTPVRGGSPTLRLIGSSIRVLPPMTLIPQAGAASQAQLIKVKFLALDAGLHAINGFRILLLCNSPTSSPSPVDQTPRILLELGTLTKVWIGK